MQEEGLDARKSCSFVFGEVKNCVQPDHFQQHHYPLIRREVSAFSARALQRGERTNKCSDPRTVEFRNAGEIYSYVRGSRFDELLNLIAKGFFSVAQFQRPVEIQDCGSASLADANVHMCLTALCKAI